MDLIPDDASFHERVQTLFSRFRGRGLALSASDLELVDAWAAQEAPFEVVARGIRLAAERAKWDSPDGTGELRSLKACRKSVDAELAKYLKLAAGKTTASDAEAPFHLVRHEKLLTALKKLAKTYPALADKHLEAPADISQSMRQEHLVWAWLVRALPAAERRPIIRAAREAARNQTPSVRAEISRFHREATVRHALSLKPFW